jgi:hypothetical protein
LLLLLRRFIVEAIFGFEGRGAERAVSGDGPDGDCGGYGGVKKNWGCQASLRYGNSHIHIHIHTEFVWVGPKASIREYWLMEIRHNGGNIEYWAFEFEAGGRMATGKGREGKCGGDG